MPIVLVSPPEDVDDFFLFELPLLSFSGVTSTVPSLHVINEISMITYFLPKIWRYRTSNTSRMTNDIYMYTYGIARRKQKGRIRNGAGSYSRVSPLSIG